MKKVKKLSILVLSIFIGMSLFTACPGSPENPGANNGNNQTPGGKPGTTPVYDDPNGDITITFDSNISSAPATVTQKIKSNSVITLRPNSFSSENLVFAGWGLSSSTSQEHVKYLDNSQAKFSTSTTLYAIWVTKKEGQNFNINFYMNYEGASADPYVLKAYRHPSLGLIYLPECPVIREGYRFIGWSTGKNIICPTYDKTNNHDLFMFDEDLYAIWAQDGKIPVFYLDDTDEETASTTRTDYNTDANGKYLLTLPDCQFTKEGKAFTFWNIADYIYYPKNTYECIDYVKAVAKWCDASNAVTVTLHRNHNINDTETVVYNVDKTKSFSFKNIFTKDNYVFLNWNTKADGSGILKRENDICNISQNPELINLYAIWKESNPVKITYHSNFGTDKIYEVTQEADIYFFIEGSDLFQREGYKLIKWSSRPNELYNSKYPGAYTTINEDIDLYAYWGKEGCTATYHYNDGTDMTLTQSYVSNEQTFKISTKPTRDGYDFYAWVEDVNDITTQEKPLSTVSNSFTTDQETIDFYAWWMPCHSIKIYTNYDGAQKEYYENIYAWNSFADNTTEWRVYIGNDIRNNYKVKGLSETATGNIIESIKFNDGSSEDYFYAPISDIQNYDKGPQTVEYYIIWEETN